MTRVLPPVLCYHRIGGPLELGVTRISRATFARQMRALALAGWRTLSLDEYIQTSQAAPRSFLLSFDDGYASLATEAYPILADLGFTSTTFLITDYVGKENTWDARYTWRRLAHLDWPTIETWRGRGFDFASHSATHRRLTWLDDAHFDGPVAVAAQHVEGTEGVAGGDDGDHAVIHRLTWISCPTTPTN